MRSVDGIFELDDRRLEYVWHGPPTRNDAPTIVFLHEGLGCVSLWRDYPERLATTLGWSALVYSRFGYGRSDPTQLPRPLTYMHEEAQDVLPAVLAHFDIDRAVLYGHSDGGSIALIHAGSSDERASAVRIDALVLEAPHVFVEEVGVRAIEASRDLYASAGRFREKLERHHGPNTDVAFQGWNRAWLDPGFRGWNLESFLPAVRTPTLLLQGEDDAYGTTAQLDTIRSGISAPCEVRLLPGCGHSPHREAADEVLATSASFLRRALPLTGETSP